MTEPVVAAWEADARVAKGLRILPVTAVESLPVVDTNIDCAKFVEKLLNPLPSPTKLPLKLPLKIPSPL